jgi:hypothetical protein
LPNKPAPSATLPCSLPRGKLVIQAHTIVVIAGCSAAQHVTANADASTPDACQRSQVMGSQIARAAKVGPILDATKLCTAQIVNLDSVQCAKLLSHATCAKKPFAVLVGSWQMACASIVPLRFDSTYNRRLRYASKTVQANLHIVYTSTSVMLRASTAYVYSPWIADLNSISIGSRLPQNFLALFFLVCYNYTRLVHTVVVNLHTLIHIRSSSKMQRSVLKSTAPAYDDPDQMQRQCLFLLRLSALQYRVIALASHYNHSCMH